MNDTTKEINKVTGAVISISVKLIVYALVVLLLYEAVTKGYAFGHQVFFAEAVDKAPGKDKTVTLAKDLSVEDAAGILERAGLIKSELAFRIQCKFYDYSEVYPGTYELNTSMTSKEILQALNVKPEEDENVSEPKAAAAENTAAPEKAAAVETNAKQEEGVPDSEAAFQPLVQDTDPAQTKPEGVEGQDTQETDPYGDEEDMEEGGWIEDVREEEAQ